jgi:regulator of sirC expression with transglutaminase-like and TPR domain
MTAASRAEFADVVRREPVDSTRACLLIGREVEPDLSLDDAYATLDRLASAVRLADRSPVGAAAALRRVLVDETGFRGHEEDYEDLRSSLLHEVLRRRRGLPILLSVVWCEVAARLDLPAACLAQPGHVLLRLGTPGPGHVVVDPFHGGAQREVPATPELTGEALVLRVLTNIRALAARRERSLETVRTRLWATELSLLLPHHPLDLRRERGELLVRLGALLEGAAELEEFASVVPDDVAAQTALRTARLARARLN